MTTDGLTIIIIIIYYMGTCDIQAMLFISWLGVEFNTIKTF